MKLPPSEMRTALGGVTLGETIGCSGLDMLISRCLLDIQVEMNSKQILLSRCSELEKWKYGSKLLQQLLKVLLRGVYRKTSYQLYLWGEDGKVLTRCSLGREKRAVSFSTFLNPGIQWLLNQTQPSHQLCDPGCCFTSLSVSFFICEMEIIIVFL